ncbi:MAG: general secretion pathway protein GspD [Betaproteobacteria bacterium]|nr:MAG: general secretion pathway protein GspD [Betaproteobacteria bacterium]TMI09256.1 MAG: general secretion pathway protein GspD [Betaproteobacteria bacterium]
MKLAATAVSLALVAGCAAPPPTKGVLPAISSELASAAERKPPARPEALDRALLPPVQMGMPSIAGVDLEPRFDLNVSNAPAAQVFMSIVSGTRYSILLHPEVSGVISVSLKDVTVEEALSAIREQYGYDYRAEGTRIFVQPAGLQTRVFQVNYPPGQRRGTTEIRVTSGAVTDTGGGAAPTAGGAAPASTTSSHALETSRVTTQQQSDLWADLRTALLAIVGTGEGRSVIVTPQSGVVVVRAFPQQLRAVEQYLRATRLSIERQVMLEAKIIEVTLSGEYQAGINWAIFNRRIAAGQLSSSAAVGGAAAASELVADTARRSIVSSAGAAAASNPAGAVFGLALQTPSFAALLTFLESQGNVQVLSSPRIATLNNQKAVLKVGTDEFFVTNVSTTTTTTSAGSQTSPSVTVQPFFSGIVLDVTPQIDQGSNIILHIHPSVSEVTESTRVVNLGGGNPSITLPLAKSTVNETDTIVRVTDGNIVAIGGLMSVDVRDRRGGVPGLADDSILRNTDRTVSKRELVILLKPTLIVADRNWEQDIEQTRGRLESLNQPSLRGPR